MRNGLISRMVAVYSLEHPVVIEFCRLCDLWENNSWNDRLLDIMVRAHEENPVELGDDY